MLVAKETKRIPTMLFTIMSGEITRTSHGAKGNNKDHNIHKVASINCLQQQVKKFSTEVVLARFMVSIESKFKNIYATLTNVQASIHGLEN